MEFRILGPLEVIEHDRPLALGGAQQRSLLAMLLLHANEFVSTDRLVDALWGQTPPPTAAKTVQVYVSRLRKELGERRLLTGSPGYTLCVEVADYDLARFERLVAQARSENPRSAAQTLRRALALWRGPPLADLAYERSLQAEIGRLAELRWNALERRIEADLACRLHADLVGELKSLVAEHPLRERLRGHLMLALYRSGRQAEALDAYRTARQELAEELGLEPSAELKRLEQAILRQEPGLDVTLDATPPRAPATARADRSLLIVPRASDDGDALLGLAVSLAGSGPARELIVARIVDPTELASATTALAALRERLLGQGAVARTAAFSSPTPGHDLVRLASQQNVELLLMSAARPPLDGEAGIVLEHAPCDVALLVESGGLPKAGPVVVPFGAAWHDWAALELGAWVSRATGAPLRLIGAASAGRKDGRDASRLLADASLIVQRTAGVVAEPFLVTPGRGAIAAGAEGAGLLVVALPDSWRQDGLGRVRTRLVESPPAPTVLVRRGARPGGLAPPETASRFGWSLTVDAA